MSNSHISLELDCRVFWVIWYLNSSKQNPENEFSMQYFLEQWTQVFSCWMKNLYFALLSLHGLWPIHEMQSMWLYLNANFFSSHTLLCSKFTCGFFVVKHHFISIWHFSSSSLYSWLTSVSSDHITTWMLGCLEIY